MEKTENKRRLFTPDEANKTLPYVNRVIKDIVQTHESISSLYDRWRKLSDKEVGTADSEEIEGRIRKLLEVREEYVRELENIGCEFKDYQLGLVDFPALIGGREVCLCWQMGEPEIQFWHEPEDGFAGRRPIDDHFQ